ncbi:putative ATP-dependent RNA helicase TDRD12 [Hyperolius riggenbachi]|uniref:putative ATP-dependent RNA helicase TDRD12 n=1 Tax=Hyperolius riggenbachi TaxID=752182 RepID=UPI0035A2B0D4
MFDLSLIKVRDPSCFYCEIVKANSSQKYELLFEDLNMLYSSKYRNLEELRPTELAVGTLCVAFCEDLKSWCRAKLEAATCSEEGGLVECFLLDYGIDCPIKKTNIRFPVKECELLPFRAVKFQLHYVQPISLFFNVIENKMDFKPSKSWDTAAVHYFEQLLEEATKIEAQLCAMENNCMSVSLYVTQQDTVLCVNDELVAKRFAGYKSEKSYTDVEHKNGERILPLVEEVSTGEQSSVMENVKTKITPVLWSSWTKVTHSGKLAETPLKDDNNNHRDHLSEVHILNDEVEPDKSNKNRPVSLEPPKSLDSGASQRETELSAISNDESQSADQIGRTFLLKQEFQENQTGNRSVLLEQDYELESSGSIKAPSSVPLMKARLPSQGNDYESKLALPEKDELKSSQSLNCPKSILLKGGLQWPGNGGSLSLPKKDYLVLSGSPTVHESEVKKNGLQPLTNKNGSNLVPLQNNDHPCLDTPSGRTLDIVLKAKVQPLAFPLGQALSSNDHQNLSPSSQIFKVPVAIPFSAWTVMGRGQKLAADVPGSTATDISCPLSKTGTGEPSPSVSDQQQSSDTEQKKVPLAPVSPWPPLSDIDRQRRLSAQMEEKAISQIGTMNNNKSAWIQKYNWEKDMAKFLSFLNPHPVQPSKKEKEQPQLVRKPLSAECVGKTIMAYPTLESACINSSIKKRIVKNGYNGPNVTQTYCWAPIADGSDTIVISPEGSDPMCYIPSVLTYLNCAMMVYKSMPAKHGPRVVVLCSGWDRCHAVHKLLVEYGKSVRPLNPTLVLVGLSAEDIGGLNFRKPCEVIVTTPHCLLRCMEHHGLFLLRLCHLVLDEADVLFTKAGPQMSAILEAYKNIVSAEARVDVPQQLVAVGKAWHPEMQVLLNYAASPQVIITSIDQASLFANVQQVLYMGLECDKMSMLLQCVDYKPLNAQKILIFTESDEEAEQVYRVLQIGSVYSFLLNTKLVHNLTFVLEQWNKALSPGAILTLVVTDDYAPFEEITDATCIIHYSFPQNIHVMNSRLFSFWDYMQRKIDKVPGKEEEYLRPKSVLLMTNKHAQYAVCIRKFLQEAQAKIPTELVALNQEFQDIREKLKSDKELCPRLKCSGYCIQDVFICPYRHCINPTVDLLGKTSPVPEANNQYITVLPVCIVDAGRFYGRIVTEDDPYEQLAAELDKYYDLAENRVPVGEVKTNHLYAFSDVPAYHRVLVLKTQAVAGIVYCNVQFIDEGGIDHVPGYKLLQLPLMFQCLLPQYVEFIICRVKPLDSEETWDPKVTRLISRSIRKKQHKAKVVLNLGKTYWLDPMVHVSSLPNLSTCVYDLNVRQEILSTGMATDNPDHVTQLMALLTATETPLISSGSISLDEQKMDQENATCEESGAVPPPGLQGELGASLESTSEEGQHAGSPAPHPQERQEHGASLNTTSEEVQHAGSPLLHPQERQASASLNGTSEEGQHAGSLPLHLPERQELGSSLDRSSEGQPDESPPPHTQETQSDKYGDEPSDLKPEQDLPLESVHPEVKWFERGDTLVLTVKVQGGIKDHMCTFQSDRVLFSCHASGRHYVADLGLFKEIVSDKAKCCVKSGEAVITLLKKGSESWTRLLATKNKNVSYDYDQLEDSDESSLFYGVSSSAKLPYEIIGEDMLSSDSCDSKSSSD